MRSDRAARPAVRRSRSVRRGVFFVLATVWGFLCGTAAVLTTLAGMGHPLPIDASLARRLGVASVVAAAGGLVMAAAYREISKRSKSK